MVILDLYILYSLEKKNEMVDGMRFKEKSKYVQIADTAIANTWRSIHQSDINRKFHVS